MNIIYSKHDLDYNTWYKFADAPTTGRIKLFQILPSINEYGDPMVISVWYHQGNREVSIDETNYLVGDYENKGKIAVDFTIKGKMNAY